MGKLKRFEEMEVWAAARELTKNIYAITRNSLFYRDYRLRDQIRRASVSIAGNIAEGFESQRNPSFCRFLASARASAAEVRAQLYIALDLDYLSSADLSNLISQTESISRQITGLIKYLQKCSGG